MVDINGIISSAFCEIAADIKSDGHTHYIFKGGRGSAKSSFISVMLILGIMSDENTHGIVLRQTANTLLDSVYSQLIWAIYMLEVSDDWQERKSPLKLVYTPTGQQILFRGADDPLKIKSIKPPFGYFGYVWYEEWHEFNGMDDIRSINQSVLRGGERFKVFYSFNPPKSINNWVNVAARELGNGVRDDTVVHHSTYLSTPVEWLGSQFIIEADYIKENNPEAYRHEYMGEATGIGGLIFENVEIRKIEFFEKDAIDYFYYGIDWGFAIDPAVFIEVGYIRKKKIVYVTDEIFGVGMTNRVLAEKIIGKGFKGKYIQADSAEPKSVYDMNDYGLNVRGVMKWSGSVKNGIEFLQNLDSIIIDPLRCPNAAREFPAYEYLTDRNNGFIPQYPDRNNHTIDAVRYALSAFILERKRQA